MKQHTKDSLKPSDNATMKKVKFLVLTLHGPSGLLQTGQTILRPEKENTKMSCYEKIIGAKSKYQEITKKQVKNTKKNICIHYTNSSTSMGSNDCCTYAMFYPAFCRCLWDIYIGAKRKCCYLG